VPGSSGARAGFLKDGKPRKLSFVIRWHFGVILSATSFRSMPDKTLPSRLYAQIRLLPVGVLRSPSLQDLMRFVQKAASPLEQNQRIGPALQYQFIKKVVRMFLSRFALRY